MEETKEIQTKKQKSYKGKFILTFLMLIISIIVNVSLIININSNKKPYDIVYNGIEKYFNQISINITFKNTNDSGLSLDRKDFSVEYDGQRMTANKITVNDDWLNEGASTDIVVIFSVTNSDKLGKFYFQGKEYFEI